MILQQKTNVKFKRNVEATQRLRDTNIRISKERGRGELKGDDQEGIKAKITASQVKKHKRRKEQWKKRQQKQSQKQTLAPRKR